MKQTTKFEKVKRHLLRRKSITSWESIKLYAATRLAVMIFRLRRDGWKIESRPIVDKDKVTLKATRYVLIQNPKK